MLVSLLFSIQLGSKLIHVKQMNTLRNVSVASADWQNCLSAATVLRLLAPKLGKFCQKYAAVFDHRRHFIREYILFKGPPRAAETISYATMFNNFFFLVSDLTDGAAIGADTRASDSVNDGVDCGQWLLWLKRRLSLGWAQARVQNQGWKQNQLLCSLRNVICSQIFPLSKC